MQRARPILVVIEPVRQLVRLIVAERGLLEQRLEIGNLGIDVAPLLLEARDLPKSETRNGQQRSQQGQNRRPESSMRPIHGGGQHFPHDVDGLVADPRSPGRPRASHGVGEELFMRPADGRGGRFRERRYAMDCLVQAGSRCNLQDKGKLRAR